MCSGFTDGEAELLARMLQISERVQRRTKDWRDFIPEDFDKPEDETAEDKPEETTADPVTDDTEAKLFKLKAVYAVIF